MSHYITTTLVLCMILISWCTFFSNKKDSTSPLPQSEQTSQHISSKNTILRICKYNHPYTNNQRTAPLPWCTVVGHAVAIHSWYMLTAKHVLQGSKNDRFAFVDHTDTLHDIHNQWFHPTLDLALLQYTNYTWSYSSISTWNAITWDAVRTYGYIQGIHTTFSWNIISLTHSWHTQYTTSLNLFPTLSWSPIFDTSNNLIAINTAISNQTKKTSYALAIDQDVLDEWISEIQ